MFSHIQGISQFAYVSYSQQALEFSSVKTHDDFAIHYNDRGRSATDLLDQFFHGISVLSHIPVRKRDLVMRKKLFRCMTRSSTSRRINGNFLLHF